MDDLTYMGNGTLALLFKNELHVMLDALNSLGKDKYIEKILTDVGVFIVKVFMGDSQEVIKC